MNLFARGFVKSSCGEQKMHEGQILATFLRGLFPTRPISPTLPSSLFHTLISSFFCIAGICLQELWRFPPRFLFSPGEDVLSLPEPSLGPTCTWAESFQPATVLACCLLSPPLPSAGLIPSRGWCAAILSCPKGWVFLVFLDMFCPEAVKFWGRATEQAGSLN